MKRSTLRRIRQRRKRLARKHLLRRRRVQVQQRAAANLRTAWRMETAFRGRIETKAKLQAALHKQLAFKNIDFGGTNIRIPKGPDTESAKKILKMWEHNFPAMKEWLKRPVKPVVAELDYSMLERRILQYAAADVAATVALHHEIQESEGRHKEETGRQPKSAAMTWAYGALAGAQVRAGGAGVPTK